MVRALLLVALVLIQPSAAASGGSQDPSPEAVNAAIERGVSYLLRSQNRDGSWGVDLYERGVPWHDLRNGPGGLALYTLIKCGLPPDHPALQRGLGFLLQELPARTYSIATQLMALGATGDPAYRERMQELVTSLLEIRQGGGWVYPLYSNPPDLSNTQYAAMGLRAARLAGVEIPRGVWKDLVGMALRFQAQPLDVPAPAGAGKVRRRVAGFVYMKDGGFVPTGSMTTAGLTILGAAGEALGKLENEAVVARDLALGWLDHNFSAEANPSGDWWWHIYYLYGLERVGALLGLERIGEHDWYREGALQLLKKQRPDGGWWNDGRTVWPPAPQPIANTCFALLFLRKATLSPPGGRREHFFSAEDPAAEVWVRVAAKRTWTLWVSGFSPGVLARFQHGDEPGLHVEKAEWWIDGTLAESVAGEPARAWKDERFAVQHEPGRGGEHALECRVTLRAEGGPPLLLRSATLSVPAELVLEPWMLEYCGAQADNLLATVRVSCQASSEESQFHVAADAVDGLQGSSWLAKSDDPVPWLRLELEKPVRVREIWISPAGASELLRASCATLTRVELRLNGDSKPLAIELDPDPRLKTRAVLPHSLPVHQLEIRIVGAQAEPGKWLGLTEIEIR